jgi:serine phosphatase RsbU (regulator of sigma subunit)/CHASE2 domain-containing sensor protein
MPEASPPTAASRWRARLTRPRALGVVFLLALCGLQLLADTPVQSWLREGWFDLYQRAMPRERVSAPAVIVAVDEKSLARHGQWPWPRTLIAELLDALAAFRPLAIGIDVVFAEPDRHSPGMLAERRPDVDAALARELKRLPDNDAVLAAAIKRLPVVLGVAGTYDAGQGLPPRSKAVFRADGDPLPSLWQFPSALKSIDSIDQAATSRALLSTEAGSGVVRRVPLIAAVASAVFPALSLETLRVGIGADVIAILADTNGIESVVVGDAVVPIERDGHFRVRYSGHDPGRFVSASDVLAREADAAMFERKLVLFGVTGVGLLDQQATPVGERMPGIEIHAQILENIFDRDFLTRPRWTRWAEAALIALLGAALVLAVPAVRPLHSSWLLLLEMAALAVLGAALFRYTGVLFDAALPALSLNVLFGGLLRATLAETARQRERLRRELEAQREAATKIAGELEAARRVQMGMLPVAAQMFDGEKRFELHTYLDPAREVGGDFYDFFMLGESRLFFLVGDVSGKGMPASIFMALSKALYKSTVLRGLGDLGQIMWHANAEISRENPELMFVTALACVLDVETGELTYCNAGHETPYAPPRGGKSVTRLAGGGGPPLCMLEEFPYETARYRMSPGESLVLVSDGVTEAMNPAGELFGRARLERLLSAMPATQNAEQRVNAVRDAVREFSAGAEMADDITILALRWLGSFK